MTGKSFGQHVDDKMTTASVKTKLTAIRGMNASQVGVDTNHGVVYLEGTVTDQRISTEAEQIARGANGVRDVVNHLWVRDPQAASRIAPPRAARPAPRETPAAASPETRAAAPKKVMAPAAGYSARHSTTGEVTGIDRDKGRVTVKTPEGEYELNMPAAELASIKEGDRLELSVVRQRPH